ncbi:MAG: hypothetical protein HY840_08375 [Bacteroidetes bacterium]|nr:hypothetical protein [Bacteroidota bacterium]
MEQTTTQTENTALNRPQFLTVLCILTYIGVGITIIGSIVGWWSIRAMSAMMDASSNTMEEMPGLDMSAMPDMEKMMNTLRYSNILLFSGVIGSLICLVGALQMWKQKKAGFFIYVIGEVAPIIVSIVCLGTATISGWSAISLIFPVVFLILYGLNLKHMH